MYGRLNVVIEVSQGIATVTKSEYHTNSVFGNIDTIPQVVESQDETNIDIKEPENTAIFIDEKLDENLFISAELEMPENILYEYATQLKSFDYDKVQEAIGQNAEGNIVVSDGSDEFTGGSLTYQRNDMSNHLETYCSYAGEMGLSDNRDLSFMSQADAVARIQSFMETLGVEGELEALGVVAMNQLDLENVKKTIMEDNSYQGVLSAIRI